jgi:hypothetical protein
MRWIVVAVLMLAVVLVGCGEALQTAANTEPLRVTTETESGFSSEDREYAGDMSLVSTKISDALSIMSSRAVGFEQTFDADGVISACDDVLLLLAQAKAMTPPTVFQDVHAMWMQGVAHLESSCSLMKMAMELVFIDVESATTFVEMAVIEMQAAGPDITEATRMLEDLKTRYGE